ncbi:ADAMTS-like protein 1 [Megalops cyprinoides]|uniref:ADAMTS-like protein 1 n=1 Tax=Megalops cyprinoides TaxID=118141 RepID=UPI001864401B|nr:ADAMTS-like protein 1 [Megalops cyprinoides]
MCHWMFIPGPWSPCSRTCGAGTQRRVVKCQVLLSFSQAVADLPDDECEGTKPPATQPCYRSPCRGVQEAVVICLNKQTQEPSEESLCVSARRPPQLLRACSTEPCPPRWETGAWSSCSATCGVGLRTRAVACIHLQSRESNHTVTLSDDKCRAPKPTPVQACNRFDCPPMWELRDWGQCSRSCGGGTQKREVLCKQRLADGSILELPDTFCPSPSPPTIQSCDKRQCPPKWVPTEWSQCSATCGEGSQRLLMVCKKQEENGEYRTLAPAACAPLPQPTTVRACSLGPCARTFKPGGTKLGPSILAQRKVYIQWKKEKKLQFIMGGYAYLLPRTSVFIRCPVRRFRKGQIRWLKDGKPLVSQPHLMVTPLGYIKIQHLKASDAGVYTCVAGQAQENFVLKLIGSKRKLAVPEGNLWLTDSDRKAQRQEGLRDKAQALRVSFSQYDGIVQRLLELKGSLREGQDSKELLDSAEKNVSTLEEDAIGEAWTPLTLVTETWRLDEIIRNLSLHPSELQGPHGDQLLAQLLEELANNHGESNESTLHHPGSTSTESSTQGFVPHKPRAGQATSKPGGSAGPQKEHHRPPAIIQKALSREKESPSEVVAHVGVPVLLPRQTASVELQCEAVGSPEPVIIWSKDGLELHSSSRVGIQPGGSLRILAPSEADAGLYTCTARNPAGSTSLSSLLRIAVTDVMLYIVTGVKTPGSRCLLDGEVGNHSLCRDKNDTTQKTASCQGQHCPPRWVVLPWSPCSVSCGGGVQTRRASCQRGTLEEDSCVGAGRRPADTQLCNAMPCVEWATSAWGLCHGQCIGPRLATQHRQMFCQDRNGTRVPNAECSALRRPASYRNCSTEACALHWRVGPWTQCTSTCGSHGFQSRHVSCAHQRSGKTAREINCVWRPRPSSWQRCNILPCARGECRDSTRYCEKVRQLELCSLAQFKARCCESCRNT